MCGERGTLQPVPAEEKKKKKIERGREWEGEGRRGITHLLEESPGLNLVTRMCSDQCLTKVEAHGAELLPVRYQGVPKPDLNQECSQHCHARME